MASVSQLGHLGLAVSDVDKWERFATTTLGLEANGRDDDGSLFLRMDEYHHRFIVHPEGGDDVAYVGWQVTDEHELLAVSEQLMAAGTRVNQGTQEEAQRRRVVGLIKFADPSGIPTEVFYGPPISFERPFNSPLPISGFETGTMGMGHIVMGVDDLDQSIAFYRDVLGMRISDFIRSSQVAGSGRSMAFFHCNTRHHSLAMMPSRSEKRLHHFMLQVKDLNDVGAVYDMCQEKDVPIVRGLGRHTNDHMMSFYLRSPSGFEIEYGWGARVVDESTWQVQWHSRGSIWGHRPVAAQPAQEPAAVRS